MKEITKYLIIMLLCAGSYFFGKYHGRQEVTEPLIERNLFLETAKKDLEKEIIEIKKQRYYEAEYFKTRIDAVYGSSSYDKFKTLLQSMDSTNVKR